MAKKVEEIIRYLMVGILTTIVSLGVYYGCVLTIFDPNNALQLQLANIFSWIAAVTFAYFMSHYFVFQSHEKNLIHEATAFYSARLLTLFIDMVLMFVLVTLCNTNDKIAKLIVQVIITIANYIFSKLFVFK